MSEVPAPVPGGGIGAAGADCGSRPGEGAFAEPTLLAFAVATAACEEGRRRMPVSIVHAVMTPAALPPLFLCVDGGGSSVTVVIMSAGGLIARGSDGPCNVKTMGCRAAMDGIIRATNQALAASGLFNEAGPTPLGRWRVFQRVWLGLAGVKHQADIDEFAPFAREAFLLPDTDLRITNDGHLLASPCERLPNIDSAVVLVAGTGTVGIAFKTTPSGVDCIGISGGWGYLLGDEGSAYSVARLAMRKILEDDDARHSPFLASPKSSPQSSLLPLFIDLLHHFGVSDAAALVQKTYSDHSTPSSPTFETAEANRKVWMAEAARVVFAYAFGKNVDEPSRQVALAIAAEAVQPLVAIATRFVGDRSVIEPCRAALALGGGLWKSGGYVDLLRSGLEEKGITFAEVVMVGDPAEEGCRSLLAWRRGSDLH